MRINLEAMAIEMPRVDGHPNRLPFRGVLTLVDLPSAMPPEGSGGRRVLLTRAAAERALPSLLGMALDFRPGLDGHDVRKKVGVITSADIVGSRLEIAGYVFAKDFPDVVEKLRAGAQLGMSYEITNVLVRDISAEVWTVTQATFTGAAMLLRTRAAYPATWIALTEQRVSP